MPTAPIPTVLSVLEQANVRHAAGDLVAAERLYRDVLELQSQHVQALAGLGAIAAQRGQFPHAVEYLARACALAPGNAIFHYNLGEAFRQAGSLHEADNALRRSIDIDRAFVPAWESLIATVQALRSAAMVAGDTQSAQASAPEFASMYNNLGNAWLARSRPVDAMQCYRQSLLHRADYAMAWANLGNVLREIGQISEAESACRQAVALDAKLASGWNNLGNTLIEQNRFAEAAPCYEQALAIHPGFAQALHNLGSGSLFNRLYVPTLTYGEIAAAHRHWGGSWPQPTGRRWRNTRQPDRILRVGYLSADFREHAMCHFIEPLLAQHDASRVEVVCYAQGPVADAHTRRLIAYGHRWNWVHGLDDAALAARIEHDGIDILVDCGGHTMGTRITALASKPAPITMCWLGYLCTTGLPAMDYRLTDAWLDPPTQETPPDTEALLRIPGGMLAYRPAETLPDTGPPPCVASGPITFGSLNNIQKLNPPIVARWAQLLGEVPQSRLLLQSKLLGDAGMAGRVRGMFEAFGIATSRLELRPASKDFLRTYRDIDIALDTSPYGGGATTADALWMGVPVVTLAGDRPAGRLTSCLLQLGGHPEWIAESASDYVAIAASLARNPAKLLAIRGDLRTQLRASSLCDEAGFVQRLEAVYRAAWQRWLESAPPPP